MDRIPMDVSIQPLTWVVLRRGLEACQATTRKRESLLSRREQGSVLPVSWNAESEGGDRTL